MLESDHEMHCVIAHFIRGLLRLEIKRAERAVTTAGDVKLRVKYNTRLLCRSVTRRSGYPERWSLPSAVTGKSQCKRGVASGSSRRVSSKWLLTSLIRSMF